MNLIVIAIIGAGALVLIGAGARIRSALRMTDADARREALGIRAPAVIPDSTRLKEW